MLFYFYFSDFLLKNINRWRKLVSYLVLKVGSTLLLRIVSLFVYLSVCLSKFTSGPFFSVASSQRLASWSINHLLILQERWPCNLMGRLPAARPDAKWEGDWFFLWLPGEPLRTGSFLKFLSVCWRRCALTVLFSLGHLVVWDPHLCTLAQQDWLENWLSHDR